MTDQTLTIDQLLQSVLDDILSNMPAALSPKIFHPIKEEPLTDDNKENIPPTPEPFNFGKDLIALYDKEFSDPMLYHTHTQENLLDLVNNTDQCMFDSAYCNHLLGDALLSSLRGIVVWSSYLDPILSHPLSPFTYWPIFWRSLIWCSIVFLDLLSDCYLHWLLLSSQVGCDDPLSIK